MVKLVLDSDAHNEIAEAVDYCIKGLFEYGDKSGVAGLAPNGGIHAFTTLAGCSSYRAVPLVFFKKTRKGCAMEYSNIVDEDLQEIFLKSFDKACAKYMSP